MTSWRKYQEEVAEFFRGVGCTAIVEAIVQGARSEHRIDVWIVFNLIGFEHRWVIECKKWTGPIPKEKVLALKSLVDDVGANRGILVAESGFQPGAVSAAANTNITLTTLDGLYVRAKEDIQSITLGALEEKTLRLQDRIRRLGPMEETETVDHVGQKWTTFATKLPPNVNHHQFTKMGISITSLVLSFQEVKLARFPVALYFDGSDDELFWIDDSGKLVWPDHSANTSIYVLDVEQFIAEATRIVESVDQWLTVHEDETR